MQVQVIIKMPNGEVNKQVANIEKEQDITNVLWESRTYLKGQLDAQKERHND